MGNSNNLQKTIKQHHVWKRYLYPWTCDESHKMIRCLFLKQKETKVVGLTSVAQKSLFNSIRKLSFGEIIFCQRFINSLPEGIRHFSDVLISIYKLVSLGRIKENDIYATQRLEKLHSDFELYGMNLINCTSVSDLEKLNMNQTLQFLFVQYCRTERMKKNMVEGSKSFPEKMNLYDKAFPFFSLSVATMLAFYCAVNHNYQMIYINNLTDIGFITSDQPAINIKDDVTEDGIPLDFELYYPISPYSAILMRIDSEGDKFLEMNADFTMVQMLNEKMAAHADNFIFERVS